MTTTEKADGKPPVKEPPTPTKPTASFWRTSKYASRCVYCGAPITPEEPRVRADSAEDGGTREQWHPECYHVDTYGEERRGLPSGATTFTPRGVRPPKGP